MSMSAANLTQASSGVFSIHGKGLKLTTREDAEPYVKALKEMGEEVNRIHLGGNTLGIEACKALAAVIATKNKLEVRRLDGLVFNKQSIFQWDVVYWLDTNQDSDTAFLSACNRSPTLQISSLED